MGGVSDMIKNNLDPANLVHNKDKPRTLSNWVQSAHNMGDPFGANLGAAIAKHNNTQDNLRGTMDPGQLLGPNATQAPGPNPNAPGSIMNMPGASGGRMMPYNPNAGVPANGISTNGLPQNLMQNAPSGVPANGISTNGLGASPNWAAIIANALRRPPTRQSTVQGMPSNPIARQ